MRSSISLPYILSVYRLKKYVLGKSKNQDKPEPERDSLIGEKLPTVPVPFSIKNQGISSQKDVFEVRRPACRRAVPCFLKRTPLFIEGIIPDYEGTVHVYFTFHRKTKMHKGQLLRNQVEKRNDRTVTW